MPDYFKLPWFLSGSRWQNNTDPVFQGLEFYFLTINDRLNPFLLQ